MPNFTTSTVTSLSDNERHFLGVYNLQDGQSIATALSALIQSGTTADPNGTPAQRLKDVVTRTNGTGSPIKVQIHFTVSL